jgi:hypothetical protein
VSKQNQPLLTWELKPSNRLKQTMMILHLFACVAGIVNSLAIPIKLVLCTTICLHLGFIIKQLRNQNYLIRYSQKLGWEMEYLEDVMPVTILNATVISTFVIILAVKLQNDNKMTLVVASDALATDDFRQLIVYLKITAKSA